MEGDNNSSVPTIESLQAELNAERTAHDATKADRDLAVQQHVEASTSLAEAAIIIGGQSQTIAEQEAQIISLQVSPAEFPTITVDKVSYLVDGKRFQYKGVDYTVEQLLKDKKLQKELVDKGVGFLIKKEV